MAVKEDLVKIESGRVEAVGAAASLRLQAREGLFHMLPSPPQLVVLREAAATADSAADHRTCKLSGEISAPGDLCDVFGFISQAGWCGEVIVFDHAGSRSLYVERGDLVGATSTVPSERLGQVLYRYGVLTEEQVTQCVAAAATTMWFGEAAVKLGLASRQRLFELMARQAEEIFFGCLLVGPGMFYFLDSFDPMTIPSRHSLSIPMLVRDGVRRMHETRYFRSKIPSEQHVPVPRGQRPPPSELDPSGLYAALDGRRSIADLCRLLGESEFIVTRCIFQMVHQGFVDIRSPRRDPRLMVLACNEAVATVLRELDALDAGDAVRSQLAEFTARETWGGLFAGAGPSDDGAFDPERVLANSRSLTDEAVAEQRLSGWLRDYAAYALFLARPHLARREQVGTRPDGPARRLSERVGAFLDQLGTSATMRSRGGE